MSEDEREAAAEEAAWFAYATFGEAADPNVRSGRHGFTAGWQARGAYGSVRAALRGTTREELLERHKEMVYEARVWAARIQEMKLVYDAALRWSEPSPEPGGEGWVDAEAELRIECARARAR